ncbi:MAG TPA: lecithin retinol acyltransferase family protein [Candidatus Hydrogenedentes bacterium]|nr:lecithin retinol acyltransferase family protein [Candidatus Hydrogenedentota bacterium]HOV75063.1 lecithin retinol acyltransferase family protein [Candidatus Hydrogenedentota bacterium]HPC15226.1 lecithin retinol acyltransferase family protein [Candidatus Hydrogenedentota bacterium]HRT19519.1 lecithin retinol acyltransferase family protein [Candidatus Hydrogenedentota bacterium]HRT64225.1 lecithin retinol acyltransferase family protein [Candidatus Hydrogenedentota bacterium]
MSRGDHIRVRRLGYWHHGIDCGDGTVIHYSGELFDNKRHASIQRTSMAEFTRGGCVETVVHDKSDNPDCVMMRAESRLGESGYGIFTNNCEHFARWCQTGRHESPQVRSLLRTAALCCASMAGLVASAIIVNMRRSTRHRHA